MRPLQVWFQEEQYELLRAESARTGQSISELVRAALEEGHGRRGDGRRGDDCADGLESPY